MSSVGFSLKPDEGGCDLSCARFFQVQPLVVVLVLALEIR